MLDVAPLESLSESDVELSLPLPDCILRMIFISWATSCSAEAICDWSSDDEELVLEELLDELPDSMDATESSDADEVDWDVRYL